MLRTVLFTFTFIVAAMLLHPVTTNVLAAVSETSLSKSIAVVQAYRGKEVWKRGSAFVVQADRFNGYLVTNAELVDAADTYTVVVPGSGAELVAQVVRKDLSGDYALLKVNGLNLPPMTFSVSEPSSGEVVWSAAKVNGSDSVTLIKGILRTGFKLSERDTGWYQHTANIGNVGGAALLNECGEVLGLNFSEPASDGSVRSLDLSTLRSLLDQQNVKLITAEKGCISEVVLAREKAELASTEARRAQDEAEKAQMVARDLERQLQVSQRSNDALVRQTREAKERAESALKTAELAQANAQNMRRELEEKTSALREETKELLKAFEEDRLASEERFQDLLQSQQEAAASRERILIGFAVALIIIIGVVVFLARARNGGGGTSRPAARRPRKIADPGSGDTQVHREDLAEYVLDGRDDDGIRYLLRISGDQLIGDDGVVIGRNPKDSPYIINHADVSRKHARIRVMKNRVFIEDLGSTNGTSVNGQSIDDKGLVSVDNGDQIIIGSVVMKLRVMEG